MYKEVIKGIDTKTRVRGNICKVAAILPIFIVWNLKKSFARSDSLNPKLAQVSVMSSIYHSPQAARHDNLTVCWEIKWNKEALRYFFKDIRMRKLEYEKSNPFLLNLFSSGSSEAAGRDDLLPSVPSWTIPVLVCTWTFRS